MPEITLIEGRNALGQLDEKIMDVRRIIEDLLNPNKVRRTTESEPTPVGTDIREEEVITSGLAGNVDEKLEEYHKKLDELHVERSKLEVAMKTFEATQKFTF